MLNVILWIVALFWGFGLLCGLLGAISGLTNPNGAVAPDVYQNKPGDFWRMVLAMIGSQLLLMLIP